MAIHVAVVDDDQAVRSRISDFLKRYGEEKGVNWNISFFKTGTEFLFQYQAKYDQCHYGHRLYHHQIGQYLSSRQL